MLEMAYEVIRDQDWIPKQVKIDFREPGADKPWELSFFGSDGPSAIAQVARGEVHVAVVNPCQPLAVAMRGKGPFKEPIPLRTITVIPSEDTFAFAVSERLGISSLEELRDRRIPLRYSMRDRPDHGAYFMVREVFGALGFSPEDVTAWGGGLNPQSGFPPDVGRVVRGEVDAIFDETVQNWVPAALDAGMRIMPIEGALRSALVEMGLRPSTLRKADYPALPADVPTLDFSGWAVYTHADVPDPVVRACCAALEACRARVPWQGTGPLPLERMCVDGPGTPLMAPLHPAAEAYWRERGYIE
jgi:TRAP-type uncharacterized transport system substrate-binding protein